MHPGHFQANSYATIPAFHLSESPFSVPELVLKQQAQGNPRQGRAITYLGKNLSILDHFHACCYLLDASTAPSQTLTI
jgi:hypothetical protein